MLPYLQQLHDADEAFRAKTPMSPHADCTWPLSTRLLGRSITPENSMHLPVCLSQHCMQEEIPCFTYHDGFTFVLTFNHGVFNVTPVQVVSNTPGYYGDVTFSALPLSTAAAQFAPGALAYTIREGLQMCGNKVFVHAPPDGEAAPLASDSRPLPFVMSPIVRYDALVLLNKKRHSSDAIESFGQHKDNAREQLAIGVVCRHASTDTYLNRGHYCIHSFDADLNRAVHESIDFTFVHRCMLMDGHVVYWAMTQAAYADLIRDIYTPKNEHIRGRAFTVEHDRSSDCLYLQCFYAIAHREPSELQDTKMQVMFIIKDKNAFNDNDTTAFYDIPIFDSRFDLNVNIMPPEDASLVVPHFVFE
jgi:hypothetical protein